jgi:DNA-binding IclR family transcriptional regulator
VQLVIRNRDKGWLLEQVSGLEPVQVTGRVTWQLPLHFGSPGKVIPTALAKTDPEEWLAALTLKSFTDNIKATRTKLWDDLQHSRRRGDEEDWEEGIEVIRCVAVTILDAYQRPVGAFPVMSPSMRLPRKRFPDATQLCGEVAAYARKELVS